MPRRHLDYFLEMDATPQARYRLRNKAEGRCVRCRRLPVSGTLLCARHLLQCRKWAARWRERHAERLVAINQARKLRYRQFRKHGYSPAEARKYSASLKYLISAPPPAPPAPPVPKIPKWKEPGPKPKYPEIPKAEADAFWQRVYPHGFLRSLTSAASNWRGEVVAPGKPTEPEAESLAKCQQLRDAVEEEFGAIFENL
jgi:hypothetical protein